MIPTGAEDKSRYKLCFEGRSLTAWELSSKFLTVMSWERSGLQQAVEMDDVGLEYPCTCTQKEGP